MKNERRRLLRQLEQLAKCRVNDAVKLAFLDGSRPEAIDGLDLTPLTEFRRSNANSRKELPSLLRMTAFVPKLNASPVRIS